MVECIIEKATPEDVEEIYKIEQENFSYPWSKESFYRELSLPWTRFYTVKLTNSKEVIGYICCWVFKTEASINNFSIKKFYQRQGVGSMLLNFLISQLSSEGVKSISLEVRKSNIPAINLYKKFGFVQVGIRINFYPDNEDALVMRLLC